MAVPKSLIRKEKKSKEEEQTSAELSSAHRHLEAKCLQVQTCYIKRIIYLACHMINILLTELSRSVWENLDLGHCVRSVLTTPVKILPYRPTKLG